MLQLRTIRHPGLWTFLVFGVRHVFESLGGGGGAAQCPAWARQPMAKETLVNFAEQVAETLTPAAADVLSPPSHASVTDFPPELPILILGSRLFLCLVCGHGRVC